MPTFTQGDTSLSYEVHGDGYPLLLLAPGGMRSSTPFWDRQAFHPIRELSPHYRVIAFDQRNAGRSRAPVTAADGWHTYAADQLALLDHLGVARCHLLGCCIGSAFALRLIGAAPERVSAAVLEQPIGLCGDNRGVFYDLFDGWAAELVAGGRADLSGPALDAFKANMYGGDFVFSVSRDDVRACPAPLLVLRGNDVYHPAAISEEVARLAPRAELVERWKEGDERAAAIARVLAFLAEHTPAAG